MKRLYFLMMFLLVSSAFAVTPNPGHDASRIGAGTFSAGNYVFPAQLDVQGNLVVNTSRFIVNATTGATTVSTASLSVLPDAAVFDSNVTNLAGTNIASVENGITSFASYGGSTIAHNTSVAWEGSASVQATTNGVDNGEGLRTTSISTQASGTYTASAYVRGSGSVRIILQELDSGHNSIGATNGAAVTLSNTWQRISVTRTFGATGVNARIRVVTPSTQTITFYVDGLQLETGSTATAWAAGGETRMPGDLEVTGRIITSGQQANRFLNPTNYFAGLVGINDSTPTYALDVGGVIQAQSSLITPEICLNGDCETSWPEGAGASTAAGWTNTTTVVSLYNSANNVSANALFIDNTNGRIGISTTSPSEDLHVFPSTGNGRILVESSAAGSDTEIQFRTASTIRGIVGYDGTNSAVRLTHGSGLTNGISINSAGNVGIGTTTPNGKVHVSTGTSGDALVYIEADTDNNAEGDNPRIILREDGNTSGADIGFDEPNYGNDVFGISRYLSNAYTYDGIYYSIQTGRVGVGTVAPTQKLDVNGSANVTSTTYTPQLCLNGDCRTSWPSANGSSSAGGWTNTTTLVSLSTSTNNVSANALFIDNMNARVGIGDTTPTNKLDVAGAIGISDTTIIDASRNIVNAGTGAFSGALSVATINTGSGAKELGDVAVANGDTDSVPTGDQVYDFVTGLGYINDGNTNWDNSYGFITDDTSVPKNHITNSGTLSFDWADSETVDALTVSGGTLGSNTISSGAAWTITNTLDVDSSTLYVDGTNNRVGIGTSSPEHKLDVAGTAYVQGQFYADYQGIDHLPNGNFESGTANGFSGFSGVFTNGAKDGNYAAYRTGGATIFSDEYIPVDTDGYISIEGWFMSNGTGGQSRFYFGTAAYNENKTLINGNGGTYGYCAASSQLIPTSWTKYTCTLHGEGTGTYQFPSGTKYVRMLILANYQQDTNYTMLIDGVSYKTGTASEIRPDGNIGMLARAGAGNLGIGTISPAYKLDVTGNGHFSNGLQIDGNAINSSAGLTVSAGTVSLPNGQVNNAEISELDWTKLQNYPASCGAGQVLQAVGDTLTCVADDDNPDSDAEVPNAITVDGGTISGTNTVSGSWTVGTNINIDSNTLYIDGASNEVGVGTSAPETRLDIQGGDILLDNNRGLYIEDTTGANQKAVFYTNGNQMQIGNFLGGATADVEIHAGGSDVVHVEGDGDVGIGIASPGEKLDVENGHIQISNGYTLRTATADLIYGNGDQVSIGTSSRMVVNSTSGNVGIGTASPGRKLEAVHDDGVTSGEHWVANFGRLDDAGVFIGYRADGAAVSGGVVRAADNLPLYFGTTGAQQAITILNTGNVGIGALSPDSALHVEGDANIGDTTAGGTARTLHVQDKIQLIHSGSNLFATVQGPANRDLYIDIDGNGVTDQVRFRNVGSLGARDVMSVRADGTVGIGTVAPSELLEISSATGTATLDPTTLRLSSTSSAADWNLTEPWANIDFYSADGSGDGAGVKARIGSIMENAAGAQVGIAFYTERTTDGLSEKMRLDAAGNLGIGITNPTAKLMVYADGSSGAPGSYPTQHRFYVESWAGDGPASDTGIALAAVAGQRISYLDTNAANARLFQVTLDDRSPLIVRGNAQIYMSDDLFVGHGAANDDDYIYMDQGAESIRWEEANTWFEFSDKIRTGDEVQGTQFVDNDNTNYYINPAGQSILAGDISIGTTGAPSTPIDVIDPATDVISVRTSGAGASYVKFYGSTTTHRGTIGWSGSGVTGFVIKNEDNSPVTIGTMNTPSALVVADNGDVTTTGDLYINGDDINSNTDAIHLHTARADDTSYEWVGYYSGGTRQGIVLYDGSWAGCNSATDEFCVVAENSNHLSLKAASGKDTRISGSNVVVTVG